MQFETDTDGSRDGDYVDYVSLSIGLPDSASILIAEIWAVIKALEQIKDSVASKYIIFTCLQAIHYLKVEHPLDWVGDRKICLFNFCQ